MRGAALALSCLACAGHGHRVQVESSAPAEALTKLLTSSNAAAGWQVGLTGAPSASAPVRSTSPMMQERPLTAEEKKMTAKERMRMYVKQGKRLYPKGPFGDFGIVGDPEAEKTMGRQEKLFTRGEEYWLFQQPLPRTSIQPELAPFFSIENLRDTWYYTKKRRKLFIWVNALIAGYICYLRFYEPWTFGYFPESTPGGYLNAFDDELPENLLQVEFAREVKLRQKEQKKGKEFIPTETIEEKAKKKYDEYKAVQKKEFENAVAYKKAVRYARKNGLPFPDPLYGNNAVDEKNPPTYAKSKADIKAAAEAKVRAEAEEAAKAKAQAKAAAEAKAAADKAAS